MLDVKENANFPQFSSYTYRDESLMLSIFDSLNKNDVSKLLQSKLNFLQFS